MSRSKNCHFVDIREEIKKMEIVEMDRYYKGPSKEDAIYSEKDSKIWGQNVTEDLAKLSDRPVQVKLVGIPTLLQLDWK